jgi:hypothetical protein
MCAEEREEAGRSVICRCFRENAIPKDPQGSVAPAGGSGGSQMSPLMLALPTLICAFRPECHDVGHKSSGIPQAQTHKNTINTESGTYTHKEHNLGRYSKEMHRGHLRIGSRFGRWRACRIVHVRIACIQYAQCQSYSAIFGIEVWKVPLVPLLVSSKIMTMLAAPPMVAATLYSVARAPETI